MQELEVTSAEKGQVFYLFRSGEQRGGNQSIGNSLERPASKDSEMSMTHQTADRVINFLHELAQRHPNAVFFIFTHAHSVESMIIETLILWYRFFPCLSFRILKIAIA